MPPESHLEDVPGSPGLKATPGFYQEEAGKESLRCFLNADRVCGPACMAYTTFVPNQADYRDQPWPHCIVLINLHRAGKHLTVLASHAERLLGKATDTLDAQRNIPPPVTR